MKFNEQTGLIISKIETDSDREQASISSGGILGVGLRRKGKRKNSWTRQQCDDCRSPGGGGGKGWGDKW